MHAISQLEAGAKIKEYTLHEKIGQGSSGVVWAGISPENEPVVIKIIPLNGWRKQEFEREVDALDKLRHENVVKLHESFVIGKHGVCIIEKLDRDLLDFLDDYTVNEAEARMMFRQILGGIHHLHENCVAHMDIKPENILISGSDVLKVGDLGSTYFWGASATSLRTGKAGTSFYCAPEVKSGRPYHADKADIWSLGITLHVMLTGFWPYLGQTEKEVLNNAKKGQVDIAEETLSDDLVDLMKIMLRIVPEDRPDIPSLLQHTWFKPELESSLVFTPRGERDTSRYIVSNSTEYSESSTEPSITEEDVTSIVLPELSLDGLKSPRQCMMTPRVGINDLDDGLIRPSPRAPPGQGKQSKLGKIFSNFIPGGIKKGIMARKP